MSEIKFEIIDTLGVISENETNFKKKLTLISWNEREPKYDIRPWNEDYTKMKKGLTFSLSELQKLKEILNDLPELD